MNNKILDLKKSILQLCFDRDFDIVDKELNKLSKNIKNDINTIESYNKKDVTDKILICLPKKTKIGLNTVKICIKLLKEKNINKAFIIVKDEITEQAKEAANVLSSKYQIEFFIESDILNNDKNSKNNSNLELSDDEDFDEEELKDDFIHNTFDNPGWADVISKILKKKPKLLNNQESCILVKAKKDFELIEIEKQKRTDKEKHLWENLCRSKPKLMEKDRERKLTAIATRGVVQLFNQITNQKQERRKK